MYQMYQIGYWYWPVSASLYRLSEYRLNLVSVHPYVEVRLCSQDYGWDVYLRYMQLFVDNCLFH